MRKKSLIIFVFIFSLFFCLNIDGVFARQDEFGGGSGISYSYGIVCSYGGKRAFKTSKSSTIGGGHVDQNYPFTYALKVNCNNTSCEKLSVSTYGLVKDQNGAKKEIKISNKDNLSSMVNNDKGKFGFKKGEGVSNCPDKVGFEWSALNGTQLDKVNDFGNFVLNSNNKQGSLEKKQKFSADEARKIDIKNIVDSSVSGKKRTTTDTTGDGENTISTEIENEENTGNQESVDSIHDASDEWSSEDGNSSNESVSCAELLGDENVELISNILFIISIVGVVLGVVLGSVDFLRAIVSSDDDALAQAWKKFKFRIISIVILLLLPVLVDFILSFVNDNLHFKKVDVNGDLVGDEITVEVGKASDCS